MLNAKAQNIPMASGLRLLAFGSDPAENVQWWYKFIVGVFQYVTVTRPEISYCVNKVWQFMHMPLESHWNSIRQMLRYLRDTLDFCLHLEAQKSLELTAFCHSNCAVNPNDRRSTSSYCLILGQIEFVGNLRSNIRYLSPLQKQSFEAWQW